MRTEELIKETTAETGPAIETAAKNVEALIDRLRRAQDEINQLQDHNLELRKNILQFKNWTEDRLRQVTEDSPEVKTARSAVDAVSQVFSGDKSSDRMRQNWDNR